MTNSCTINIVRYANAAGRAGRFDVNGLIDGYHSSRVDTTLEAAQAADGAPDFSERIRASLSPTPTR